MSPGDRAVVDEFLAYLAARAKAKALNGRPGAGDARPGERATPAGD